MKKGKKRSPRSSVYNSYSYVYAADGSKLRKLSLTTRDYIDGIEYNNGSVEFVATEEGRAINAGGTSGYQYYLKDHLGNTRATIHYDGSIVQVQDYYPFGMDMATGNTYVPSPDNRYKYNGKEKQDETGQLDYGARFYDPVIGRWTSIDPLAEQMPNFSPYNYAEDNPVKLVDPDGMKPTPNWVKFIDNINRLVANGLSGKSDPNRSCNMCCLNALASNLNSLYNTNTNIPVDDKFSTAVTSLDANKYVSIPDAIPTYDGSTLSTRSNNNISSDDLVANMDKINTNITQTLIDNTKDDQISVFALGLGMQYHSTMVVVSKNADQAITIDGKKYTGSKDNPLFIFVEDFGGARAFDSKSFEALMQAWVFSARKY